MADPALSRNFGLPPWPPRPLDSHKGLFGRVGILAGSRGMAGAAYLAAQAAVRGGAGLVTAICPASIASILAIKLHGVMTLSAEETDEGNFGIFALKAALSKPFDVFVLGPGIGRHKETLVFVRHVFADKRPMVIDADALYALVDGGEATGKILTPHPGEMAALLGWRNAQVQADRRGALKAALRKFPGATIVLKGHQSLVGHSDPDNGLRIFENSTGNPGMATGGTGDVLAGLLGALLGQGFASFEAACLGTHLHGRAGDLARDRVGEVSLSAEDLLEALPRTVVEYRGI